MKIILLKEIEKLGVAGEVVEAKGGYVRNYLVPNGFAMPVTKESFSRIEEAKKRKAKLQEKEKKETVALKEKLEAVSLTITCEVKENDAIYGSIGESQIIKSLADEGIELEKGRIVFEAAIKNLGVYNLKVNLSPEVSANLRVWVVKK